jgi:hypothetical protein
MSMKVNPRWRPYEAYYAGHADDYTDPHEHVRHPSGGDLDDLLRDIRQNGSISPLPVIGARDV